MSKYLRLWNLGGCYFFTVNLQQRRNNDLLIRHIDTLREAVRHVRSRHPFIIHGWVVLPDHLHCLIELPAGDCNYAIRWSLIKSRFSRNIPPYERRSKSQSRRGERGIWQRRYWEHAIRNEQDYRAHLDYIHINPLKHGLVERVSDWPYSTFHHSVAKGLYREDWADDCQARQLAYDD
ncbi:transposase [Marinobacterium aestuarii]|uniref:Transposase n=1 Tax=Marinobacterium aestuarii TaxID=1821621 RepID=A0A1A9EVR3_9GAMM|nr:transposase [Marinobacterium aestuarii]ANG61731.1 transposase [Marinobacterium aestuarii]